MTQAQIITLAIAEAIIERRAFTALALSDGTRVNHTMNA
jgi:hypothetical protein